MICISAIHIPHNIIHNFINQVNKDIENKSWRAELGGMLDMDLAELSKWEREQTRKGDESLAREEPRPRRGGPADPPGLTEIARVQQAIQSEQLRKVERGWGKTKG